MEDFRTKDLYLAAALLAKGYVVKDVERETRVCWFIFSGKDECQRLEYQYWFSELLIDARKYKESLERLKDLIFS